jgi:ubiquinone/menaquinone biosynthesis C-methylase UbiE
VKVRNTKWVEDEKEFHDAEAAEYEKRNALTLPYHEAVNEKRINDLAKLIRELQAVRILEVGSGTGYTLIPLIENVENAHFSAVDISYEMIKIAKDQIRHDGSKVRSSYHLLVADAMELPFEDNSFQVVYLIATLHHLPDLHLALSEYYRVLTKGGVLYINDGVRSSFLDFVSKWILRRRNSREALSPHERNFPLPVLLKETQHLFCIERYEVSNLFATTAGGSHSGSIAALALTAERVLAMIPIFNGLGLGITLWCRKT